MTGATRALLERLVSLYDREGQPVAVSTLADRTDTDADAARAGLESLASYELVERAGEGYEPTVTGREFLELDLDDDSLVVIETSEE